MIAASIFTRAALATPPAKGGPTPAAAGFALSIAGLAGDGEAATSVGGDEGLALLADGDDPTSERHDDAGDGSGLPGLTPMLDPALAWLPFAPIDAMPIPPAHADGTTDDASPAPATAAMLPMTQMTPPIAVTDVKLTTPTPPVEAEAVITDHEQTILPTPAAPGGLVPTVAIPPVIIEPVVRSVAPHADAATGSTAAADMAATAKAGRPAIRTLDRPAAGAVADAAEATPAVEVSPAIGSGGDPVIPSTVASAIATSSLTPIPAVAPRTDATVTLAPTLTPMVGIEARIRSANPSPVGPSATPTIAPPTTASSPVVRPATAAAQTAVAASSAAAIPATIAVPGTPSPVQPDVAVPTRFQLSAPSVAAGLPTDADTPSPVAADTSPTAAATPPVAAVAPSVVPLVMRAPTATPTVPPVVTARAATDPRWTMTATPAPMMAARTTPVAPVPVAKAESAQAASIAVPLIAVNEPATLPPQPMIDEDAGAIAVAAPVAVAPPAAFLRQVTPAQDAVPVAPLPVVAPEANSTSPALQVFSAAIRAASSASEDKPIATATDPFAPVATPVAEIRTVAATADARQAPFDMSQPRWPHAMIDRIEQLRDAANSVDTRIRLIPDALGTIDVSVRTEGNTLHVNFHAEQAATRTMIQDAAPRLAAIAEERGLKLGQSTTDTGTMGQQQQSQQRHAAQQGAANRAPVSTRIDRDTATDDGDGRLA